MSGAVWRALADPTRRRILDLLRDGPQTTGALCAAFPEVTRFSVMKHLDVLSAADLVVIRRRGRERWNHLNGVPLRQAYERWMRPHTDAAATTLLRLAEHVTNGATMPIDTDLDVSTVSIEHQIRIAAERDRVFDALTHGFGAWWPHRFSADATVHFEAHPGGRVWEESAGGGALYGFVQRIARPTVVAVQGPMGMRTPVAGVITYELDAEGDTTVVRLSHRVVGEISEETRATYTEGWGGVLAALQAHLAA